MAPPVRIAVCKSESNWHVRFIEALDKHSGLYGNVSYRLMNIDSSDWIAELADFDAVIWRPHYMGVEASSFFKEKVWFAEHYLKKLIVPSFETVWHFESKIAQSYIFQYLKVPHPKTIATFDCNDALKQLESFSFPLVFKKSSGAASANVELVQKREAMVRKLKLRFSRQLIKSEPILWRRIFTRQFIYAIKYWADVKLFRTNQRYAYWQEFIPNNARDLRITAIGDKYAFGFYRNNRPNDFRASGSGRIDFESPVPENLIRYCLELNRIMNFDSMAYDLVFTDDGSFRIIEMSYGYLETAIYNAPGHYELSNGNLEYVMDPIWPQELWVSWLLERIRRKFLPQK